jgi:hypothetical protein
MAALLDRTWPPQLFWPRTSGYRLAIDLLMRVSWV